MYVCMYVLTDLAVPMAERPATPAPSIRKIV